MNTSHRQSMNTSLRQVQNRMAKPAAVKSGIPRGVRMGRPMPPPPMYDDRSFYARSGYPMHYYPSPMARYHGRPSVSPAAMLHYPSPMARLHNSSLDSGSFHYPGYYPQDPRYMYPASSATHSTYSEEDNDDDASVLLAQDTTHEILGALDAQSVQEQPEDEEEVEDLPQPAPALCLTPRFLASKKRSKKDDEDEIAEDIMVQSTDSLEQILENSNNSLLQKTPPPAEVGEIQEERPKRRTRGRKPDVVDKSNVDKEDEDGMLVSQPVDKVTTQKREYSLKNWTIKPFDHLKQVIVEGLKAGTGEEVQWRSTAIKHALDKRTLQTTSGSVYKLLGPLDTDSAEQYGLSSAMCKAFKNGFPSNWKNLLVKHFKKNVEEEKSETGSETTMNVSKKVVKTKKPVSKRPVPEIRNGPSPGTTLDLSTCERTRSGRVVVPSSAVAWWKGVRLYTTPKTELQIRTETPLENQMDSPLAWPLANKAKYTFRTPYSGASKRTPATSSSKSKLASNNRTVNEKDLETPKGIPGKKSFTRKVKVGVTKAPSSKASTDSVEQVLTDSSVETAGARPHRRVARRQPATRRPQTSESVVEIPDTVKKTEKDQNESPPIQLTRSPYTYLDHKTKKTKRNTTNSNDKFRQLFKDGSADDSSTERATRTQSKTDDRTLNAETSVSTETEVRKSSRTTRSKPEVSRDRSVSVEYPVEKTQTRGAVKANIELVTAKTQATKHVRTNRKVVVNDVNVSPSALVDNNNNGRPKRSVRSRVEKNYMESDSENQDFQDGKRNKPKQQKLDVADSNDEANKASRRTLRVRKEKKSQIETKRASERSSKAKRSQPIQSDYSESNASSSRSRSKTASTSRSRSSETNRSTSTTRQVGAKNAVQHVEHSKPKRGRSRAKTSPNVNTITPKPTKPVQEVVEESEDESDTENEIFAARNRIKEKQDATNRTINRSLGLNRSVKRKHSRGDSTTLNIDTFNVYGEKETVTWQDDEIQRFRKALATIPASTDNYWTRVSELTETKSADQCRVFHLRDVPNEVKKPANKPAPVIPKLVRDENSETVRVELQGGKGTFKRKRQMQTLLDHYNQDFDNDYFDSTPWARKHRRIELPSDSTETPLPKYNSVNTPCTRLALQPRSERKTPVSSFISPGVAAQKEGDDLYIHRCVQKMRGKIGKSNAPSASDRVTPKRTKKVAELQKETRIIMELSQDVRGDQEDSSEEEDDYFSSDGEQ